MNDTDRAEGFEPCDMPDYDQADLPGGPVDDEGHSDSMDMDDDENLEDGGWVEEDFDPSEYTSYPELEGLTGDALIDAYFAMKAAPAAQVTEPAAADEPANDDDADFDGYDDDDDDEEEDGIEAVRTPVYEGPFKSGFVALVGRPNAGKSTLVNAIMGNKVVITSPTAQTTRHRISAIYNEPCMQMVLVDTPGLHKPIDALGEELNVSALNALKDVDVVAMLVDGSAEAGRGDEWVAEHVAKSHGLKVLVVTKADLIDPARANAQVERMSAFCKFDAVLVVSATEDFNVRAFLQIVAEALPEGPRWFPLDMQTDQRPEVMVAEFVREKVLLMTRDEVPHSVGVAVEHMNYDKRKDMTSIRATVFVEREGQKGIVIGAGGSMIKRIGSAARRDLERLLGHKVYLDLNVKVRPGWRSDASQIRRFGYGEGA